MASTCRPSPRSVCWRRKLKRLGRQQSDPAQGLPELRPPPNRLAHPRAAPCSAPRVVIGSLLADGIGDAILVRGEAGAGQSLRLAYNILQAAGCRSFKTDYVACPSLRADAVQPADRHRAHQDAHRASQGREDRHHGLHRERPGRNGRRRLRLRGRRARQDQPLRRQDSR